MPIFGVLRNDGLLLEVSKKAQCERAPAPNDGIHKICKGVLEDHDLPIRVGEGSPPVMRPPERYSDRPVSLPGAASSKNSQS
jgi:hypothetical protein